MLNNEHALQNTIIGSNHWDIRMSGTIVEPSDVRVIEIALRVWGKAMMSERLLEPEK